MSEKYKGKYRIASARASFWDYRWAGVYFITICTKDRLHYFGEIENGEMVLSRVGVLADVLWYEIKHHAKNVELGEFVVMPNHIHGILILHENTETATTETLPVETLHATSLPPSASPSAPPSAPPSIPPPPPPSVPPPAPPSPPPAKNEKMANISPQYGSVSAIIRSYKSAVTKHANRLGFDFAWQTRFHDHIIRDEKSFQTISQYILHNPQNWDKDKFYGTL